jgi:hypothetical protein
MCFSFDPIHYLFSLIALSLVTEQSISGHYFQIVGGIPATSFLVPPVTHILPVAVSSARSSTSIFTSLATFIFRFGIIFEFTSAATAAFVAATNEKLHFTNLNGLDTSSYIQTHLIGYDFGNSYFIHLLANGNTVNLKN